MQIRSLPARPNLEQYKKIAKDILKAWRSNIAASIPWEGSVVNVTREHLRMLHPRLSELSESEAIPAEITLADAQFIIARQYRFDNWAEFAERVTQLEKETKKTGGPMNVESVPRKVIHTHHVLAVKNLSISAAYLKEKLGFQLEFTAPGWEFLSFGIFKVMMGDCPDAMSARETDDHSYFAHCLVENVDEVYQELSLRGAAIIQPIADKPWGLREFTVATPDGHRITYGKEIE